VLLETQEQLVLKAYRVFRAIQGPLVQLAILVHKEIQDLRVLKETLALKVTLAQQATLDQLGILVLRVLLELQEILVQQDPQV
jgi:hypothetical protein